MARTAFAAVEVPSSFWDRPDVLDVLAQRDLGQLFRVLQKATGATQMQIGTAIGLSQAQVSEVMSGARKVTSIDVLARIVSGFGIPDPARATLFLGERQPDTKQRPRQVGFPDEEALEAMLAKRFLDVAAIYTSRSAFGSAHPVHELFDDATDVRAVGLSLNMLCQQYSDTGLYKLASGGARLRLLLLDPAGDAILRRESEEGYQPGRLSTLNELNLGVLQRIRDRLPRDKQENLQVAVHDETIRFNVVLVDERLCVVQPYLPHSRGVESPTIVIERRTHVAGLYTVFEQVFASAWEGGRPP
ncbi:MAG TPA: XRE family transcriptional regulator [Micromonosporaceae bacterium]|nr:XRE family transcriptional regulator [Micromonosporaceae bacterium]